MKKLITAFILTIITIVGCKNNNNAKVEELKIKEKELELKERELNLKEQSLSSTSNKNENSNEPNRNSKNDQQQAIYTNTESNLTKYVYMVFSVSEPKLIEQVFMPSGKDIFGNQRTGIETMYHVEYEKYTYTTEIQEIKKYNEEIKFKYIDKMEENVLYRSNLSFKNDVFRLSDNHKKSLENDGAKIIDKKINVFSTYKEASIHKNKSNSKL